MPGRSKEELEREHKAIKHRPEDLKDTDVEDEFKAGSKKGFAPIQNKEGSASSAQTPGAAPTSAKSVEASQKKEKLRPDELKDTDVEDEYKEQGGKFRQQNKDKAKL